MNKCYDGALIMPGSYAVMNAEEMTYVEGGYEIAQSRVYLDKKKCLEKAVAIRKEMKWDNISDYALAAEIFSHAFGYYHGGTLLNMAADLGISKAAEYLTSLEVINVENGHDSRYWLAFNLLYAHPLTGLI